MFMLLTGTTDPVLKMSEGTTATKLDNLNLMFIGPCIIVTVEE